MKSKSRIKTVLLHAFFVLLMISMNSCGVASGKHKVGRPLEPAQADRIKRGETTRRDILEWFGPPLAIARNETVMTFPPPGPGKQGYQELRSDTFFELFSAENKITEEHIIYYYYYPEIKDSLIVIIPFVWEASRLTVDSLWVLLNERTGVVEDYLFREEK